MTTISRHPVYETGHAFIKNPWLIGFILENQMAKAVLHALPVCEYIEDDFVPRNTLLLVTYFSEKPKETYREILRVGTERIGDHTVGTTQVLPRANEKHWFDSFEIIINNHDPCDHLRRLHDPYVFGRIYERRRRVW